MLTDIELERLFVLLELPEKAREMVRTARANSPVRQVKSSNNNSVISFFSRKMGNRHLQLESRTVEAPAGTTYENDPSCIEFWPQPLCADLVIRDQDGTPLSRQPHFPDFLVICSDGIYIDEWREESRLTRLAAKGSQVYKNHHDNRWHFRAAEDFFAPLKLHYRLRSALELPRTLILNFRFLEDYQSASCPALPPETASNLQKLLCKDGSIPFLELRDRHGFTADEIFKAIAETVIVADLNNYRLDVPDSLILHRDIAVARTFHLVNIDKTPPLPTPGVAQISPGAKLVFDGKDFEVVLAGGEKVLLREANGCHISLPLNDVINLYSKSEIEIINHQHTLNKGTSIANFSREQLEKANMRLSILSQGDVNKVSIRTIQHWNSKINSSMTMLEKLTALIDRSEDKGNRTRRLPEIVESLAEEAIRKHYNNPDNKTALGAYHLYQELCVQQNVAPMSYPTFTKRVKSLSSTKDREGKRKAYQETEIPLQLDYVFPIHGVRPHEVCYIDHTVINLATIGPEGSELGKPTFSLATDGNTTQARAFIVGYDPPSAKVVLMVLRDYVRRHNRLPRTLVVDGGKEFRSNELEWFCRIYGIDLRHRPPAKPRGGGPIESALGATEVELIAQLKGNTRIMKSPRTVTKSVNPFLRAEWTLTALHGALDDYLFDIRHNRIHPTLGLTPNEYECMRVAETGNREHVLVKFDENVMLLTCPHSKHRFHLIDRIRGVWCDNMYYWHDDFKHAKKGEKVEVRVEPWLANVVYVYFEKRWIAAIARDLRPMVGRTRNEVEHARRCERKLAKVNANKDRRDKSNSKKMVKLWVPGNYDARIGMQQREMECLYKGLGMTVAMPSSVPENVLAGNINGNYELGKSSPPIHPAPMVPPTDVAVEGNEITNDESFWGQIDGYH